MELMYGKSLITLVVWITFLALIITTAAATMTTNHEPEDFQNTNEDEDDSDNTPLYYSLKLNPKYYGPLQHLMNKRLKGSEFLDLIPKFPSLDTYSSQPHASFVPRSHFNGYRAKRVSEFLGGPGKKRFGPSHLSHLSSYDLVKQLTGYFQNPFKRPSRLGSQFSSNYEMAYNPKGSEFLGGPGK